MVKKHAGKINSCSPYNFYPPLPISLQNYKPLFLFSGGAKAIYRAEMKLSEGGERATHSPH
jgi:hypothetical protein